ncbi:hypothetical protein MKW98_002300, partial [Papaver atlanticum]
MNDDVEMMSEMDATTGCSEKNDLGQGEGREDGRSGGLRPYKDVVNRKETNWKDCFVSWGLNDIEYDLINHQSDEEIAGNESSEEEADIPVIKIDNQTRRIIIQPWKNCLI